MYIKLCFYYDGSLSPQSIITDIYTVNQYKIYTKRGIEPLIINVGVHIAIRAVFEHDKPHQIWWSVDGRIYSLRQAGAHHQGRPLCIVLSTLGDGESLLSRVSTGLGP